MDIFRPQTNDEQDMTPITSDGNTRGFIDIQRKKPKNAREIFEEELAKKEQEAIKKSLPFAIHVARADWKNYYEQAVKDQITEFGYIKTNITTIKIDWNKYSDIKNFEILEQEERSDDNLNKRNPGLDVTVAYKKYKFKGYLQTYTIMEDGPSAIRRARQKLKDLEPKK